MTAARKNPLHGPWAKLQREQARKILAVEKRTLVAARAAVKDVSDDAIVEIAKQPDRRHTELLALLLLLGGRMRRKLATRIRDGREEARVSAIGRLRAELMLAGVGITIAHALAPRTEADGAHADSVAASFASAWAASAVFLTSQAERSGKSAIAAVEQARSLKASALERIIATELPHAYNDEHREDTRELYHLRPDAFVGLVDRWDAMLDACPLCWAHDGETVAVGRGFRDGDEPGYMHPRCRCMRSLVPSDVLDMDEVA